MKLRTRVSIASIFCVSLGVAAWQGCSASGDSSSFNGNGGTGAQTTTSAGGGTTTTGVGGLDLPDGGQGGGQGGDNTCVAEEAIADPVQLDIVILLDRSGSMSGQKWDGSVAALKTFVNDPASAGIAVGIVYFPIEAAPDNNDCNYFHYQTLDVDVAPLPGNAPSLVTSLDAQDPLGGDTPTYGGLKGALFTATALQDANPDHKVILVLASDGDPNSCPGNQNDIPVIAALAQSALNYNGVQTYVIAISGSTVANLDQIAAAGGTGLAYDVTANVQQFSQKMAEIRAAAIGCEIIIPPPPQGETLDPDYVNVTYTPGGMGNPQKIPKADNLGDCGAGPGWYYDNPAEPTKIIFCPASCQIIQADLEAKVSVGFGCKSDPN